MKTIRGVIFFLAEYALVAYAVVTASAWAARLIIALALMTLVLAVRVTAAKELPDAGDIVKRLKADMWHQPPTVLAWFFDLAAVLALAGCGFGWTAAIYFVANLVSIGVYGPYKSSTISEWISRMGTKPPAE